MRPLRHAQHAHRYVRRAGKTRDFGGNIQALPRPDGLPVWISEVEPGSVHDLTAARTHVLGALYAAATDGLLTLADPGYHGAGIGVHTPVKQPTDGRDLDVDTRTHNKLLRSLRSLANADLPLCRRHKGKKSNGRKRHIATDTLGLLLTVVVTGAGLQDRDAALRLLTALRARLSTISLLWADGGYAGRLLPWAKRVLHLTVTIVKRSDQATGFTVLPRRWVVERTFAWISKFRRCTRDYETIPTHHEAIVYIASIMTMSRRLARTTQQ